MILAACPYTSDQPLSDPAAAAIDRSLVGTWKMQDKDSKEWHTLTFLAWDDRQLVAIADGGENEKPDAYRVFMTTIEHERFLNVQQLGADENRQWYFARYGIRDGRLYLSLVDDALFASRSFASSEALRDFIRKNLADPRLYAGDDNEQPETAWQKVEK
jgi:hypothetical protein